MTSILTLARFIKRGVDTYVYVPSAINVGNAVETLKSYEGIPPTDPRYNEEEKKAADLIIKNA